MPATENDVLFRLDPVEIGLIDILLTASDTIEAALVDERVTSTVREVVSGSVVDSRIIGEVREEVGE